VTERQILPLPFKTQKSTLSNHQSSSTADTTTADFDALGRHPWTACSLLPL
jgi:hypothetical protein